MLKPVGPRPAEHQRWATFLLKSSIERNIIGLTPYPSVLFLQVDQSLVGRVAFGLENISTNASVASAQSEFT